MKNPYLYPKLRWPIEIRLEHIEQQEILLINCPLGISQKPLVLIAAVAPIVSCFDGNSSIEHITDKFKEYGVQVELIQKLVSLLDENLFLATPKYFSAEKEVKEDFLRNKIRPAALSGLGYSANPEVLSSQIDSFLHQNNGASPIILSPSPLLPKTPMLALVSPHIDYKRGGMCYGITYQRLKPQQHDLYILIGTAHQYSDHLFHLTPKDFSSPFGVLPCDTEFVTKLGGCYGIERSFADEILHRREHSLELQLPFLQRVKGNSKIVPILVGSFYPMLKAGKTPSHFEYYESFVEGLSNCIRERLALGQRICFIVGVDMAHVGRHFGDKGALTPEFMQHIRERDEMYLGALSGRNKQALFSHVAEDLDARRICGFPSIYTMMDVLDRLGLQYETQVFDYCQAVDYKTDCAVTFAGMGIYAHAEYS